MKPARPIAVVTGASRGIGRAIARAIAPGYELILHARSESALAEASAEARAAGAASVETIAADLADRGAVTELAQELAGREPAPGVLVNNAGIAPSASLRRTDDATWDRVLAVDLFAPFALTRALLPKMKAAGWGRVVNVASTAGLKGYRFTSAYAAAKAGLVGLTRALAAEYAGTGVTINALCPGFTDTDIVAEAVANITAKTGRSEDEARATLAGFSPSGRLVRPAEVAAFVAYLCTDEADAIHGQALPIDGGETST